MMIDFDNESDAVIIMETSQIVMGGYSSRAGNQRTISEETRLPISIIRKFTSVNFPRGFNPHGEIIKPIFKNPFTPHEIKLMREFLRSRHMK